MLAVLLADVGKSALSDAYSNVEEKVHTFVNEFLERVQHCCGGGVFADFVTCKRIVIGFCIMTMLHTVHTYT